MAGLMLPVRLGLRKGRKVLEASLSAGKSQKYQLRRTTSSRTIDGPKIKYPETVNKTKPVTSPRKLYKVEQGKAALRNKPQVNEDGEAASPRDTELAYAKVRAHVKMLGDNSIGRARSRLARGESLLPHQSSAWSKHKNHQRTTRGY
jgi:hypothetical protein